MTERLKVAIVGGPDVDLRLDLMIHLRANFDVFAVGSTAGLRPVFHEAGFRYYSYPLHRSVNPFADTMSIIRLVRLLRRERPAVVHAFATKPCVLGRIAARIAGVPAIIGTLPGLGTLYTDDGNRRIGRVLVRPLYESGQGLASRLSDITILQNRDDAEVVTSRNIVPPGKLRLVPGSGVSTDVFDRASVSEEHIQATRIQLGIPADCLVAIMVARLVRAKGVLEFLEAARILRGRSPSIHFLLVGPWDRASSDALSESEIGQVSASVNWVGVRQDMTVLYALSDICVLPSYREGMPRVLMEAAAMGLPLVATDTPGCRDVVDHGTNGLLVPARDPTTLATSVAELADDRDTRLKFGAASRSIAVQRFDSRSIYRDTEGIYSAVLAKKGFRNGGLQQ